MAFRIRNATTTRALFLELVLDLALFALCASICLQVFAQAHLESVRSAALSQLGVEAQYLAETFRSGDGSLDVLAALPDAQREGETLIWRYDQALVPTSDGQARFTLSCTLDASRLPAQAQIRLYDGAEQLLAYDVSNYQSSSGRVDGGLAPISQMRAASSSAVVVAGAALDAGGGR
jgi:hypothetical protein